MELEISIPSPLGQSFTYYHPELLAPGVRVKVAFSSQGKTIGVVLGSQPDQDPSTRSFKLKCISEVIDLEPAYSPAMLELGRWLSSYYLHPLGEVLRTMLPASKTKSSKATLELLAVPSEEDLGPNSLNPAVFFNRKTALSLLTLKSKLKGQGHIGKIQDKIIKNWLKQGWVRVVQDKDVKARAANPNHKNCQTEVDGTQLKHKLSDRDNLRAPPEGLSKKEAILDEANFRALNLSQQAAVDLIIEEGIKTTAKQPFLLFGITGSGKTEVFMNVLRDLLKRDPLSQAMILVPEISLTPQMTRIFCDRFPNLVAVVHSAMDDTERWQELARIRSGDARVLIGPRSAVFGPFQKLKLIIVDEEHDSSYKQGNGLLYNARDVAVMRGRIEGAAVVLGSATPSMESWLNAISSKYRLLQLPERASKRSLPEVNTIASKPSFRAMNVLHAKDLSEVKEESPFDPEIITALSQNLGRGHQSIVLVNRRGYAYYLYNLHEQKSAECPQCSISLSVHGKRRILKCHYCDFQTTVQKVIDSSPTSTWAVVGYGSQRAEDALKIALPDAKIARLDSDIVTDPRALPEILGKFRNGEIDILVGTQILAKGHDFPNVTLICILEVDQLLGLPDFRGGERTFQLLVQAAGRAGRGEHAGNVLVQSMRSNHPIVQEALKQDFLAFAEGELRFRKAMGYPPFGRMTLFEFNGTDRVKLDHWCVSLENILDQRLQKNPGLIPQVRVLGPAAAAIEVIRGRTRRTIIVLSGSHQVTRLVSSWILEETKRLPGDIRFKVDVDPQSTM